MDVDAMITELGWTPLHYFAEKEDTTRVKELLAQGIEINTTDIYDRTPLSIASSKGNLQLVQLLLTARADANLGFPLHYACEKGHLHVITRLIKNGALVNLERENNYPLLIAASKGNLEATKILIEHGADIRVVDRDKESALHWACDSGNIELVSLLIDCGCDLNFEDKFHMTPLSVCLVRQENRPDLVRLLLAKGASVNVQDECGYTYLHSAENPESVLELIKYGADVNAQNIYNQTPLYTIYNTSNTKKFECVTCLLEHGADPNIEAHGGWTPIHVAATKDADCYVSCLLKCRADVNSASAQNVTPLHLAAFNGHFSIVKILVGRGALLDVPIIDLPDLHSILPDFIKPEIIVDGATPLALALLNGHLEICKFLVSKGAQLERIPGIPEEILRVRPLAGSNNKLNKSDEMKSSNLGWTPLHHAVAEESYDTCCTLIQNGASVNVLDQYHRSPVSVAASRNNLSILNLLLDNGADVNSGFALHFAIDRNSNECLKELLNRGCNIDTTDDTEERKSALMKAVAASGKDMVEMLLEHGANPNHVTKWGETALFKACFLNNVEMVQLLIKYGVNVNTLDTFKENALFSATMSSDLDVVKVLLEHGVDINVKNNFERTPLHNAIMQNSAEVAIELINSGASLDARDDEGETPLFLAAENATILRALLRKNVDVNYRTPGGWSPLHESCEAGNLDCVQELLKNHLNVNSASAECVLPIYLAAVRGHLSIVKELLDNGSHVDPVILDIGVIRDDSGNFPLSERYHILPGNTPLIGAASQNHLNVVKLLLSKGASLEAVNCKGNTALHETVSNGCIAIVEYFLSLDIDLNVRNLEGKSALDLAKDQANAELIQLMTTL